MNCRRIDSKLNIFSNIMANKFYLIITMLIVVGQVILVFFGGVAFQTTPVSSRSWGISILVGFFSLPLGVMIRLLPSWVKIPVHIVSHCF